MEWTTSSISQRLSLCILCILLCSLTTLALVAAAGNEIFFCLFFLKLTTIINFICASPKCHTKLHYAQAIEIAHIVATGECETGREANQIGNLYRSGTTR